jgi:glycosyltransferase involved in cell wall biosynthesis
MDNSHTIKVSIIIPTKNEEKRLKFCLDALRKLDFDQKSIEIIIIDNGSTDLTINIAKNYNCRVFIEPSKTVGGLRNHGVKFASGLFFCFIDADILVSSGWLKSALCHFQNSGIGCVTGLINIPSNATWVEKTWFLNRKTEQNIYYIDWASSMNMIIPKEKYFKLKGFSESLVTGEDVEFCSRIKKAGYDIVFDKKVSVTHIGEAKTLKEFIKKERWRGYSDLDLLLGNKFNLSNLRHGTQPLFFIFSWLLLLYSFLFINKSIFVISICLIISLPFMRTMFVLKKQKNSSFFTKLMIIWFFYYIARSIAIYDNLAFKLRKN